MLSAYSARRDEKKSIWFFYIGYSNHMFGRKEMFSELEKTFNSKVKFGNESVVPVRSKCKISIELKDKS